MVVSRAFRRSLVALAMCSAAVAVTSSPASARSHHGAARYAHGRHAHHHAWRHVRHVRHFARATRSERSIAMLRHPRFARVQASVAPDATAAATTVSGGSDLVSEARRYLGTNPTSRASLWCARFMNMVLEHTGHHGAGSDMANSFARYGQRVSGPQVGAIATIWSSASRFALPAASPYIWLDTCFREVSGDRQPTGCAAKFSDGRAPRPHRARGQPSLTRLRSNARTENGTQLVFVRRRCHLGR